MTPATRTATQLAAYYVKRRGALLLLGGSSTLTLLLVALLLAAAVFGAVAMFSGDEEGTGATAPTAQGVCPGAGTTGTINVAGLPDGTAVDTLTPAATRNAAVILQVAWAKGLGDDGAVIGIIASMAESALLNYANDGTSTLRSTAHGRQLNDAERAVARESLNYPYDAVGRNLDSMGLFQQRPMTGWGVPAELMDPAISSTKFYDALVGQVPGWRDMNPWNAAQAVQGSPSSDGGIYRTKHPQAQAVVAQLKTVIPDDVTTPPTPSPTRPSVNPPTTPASPSSAAPTPAIVLAAAPAADGGCQILGGGGAGGVGAPVVFNGEITITAPSGTYTVKLPEGPRGGFLQAVATKMGTAYVWGAAGPDVFDCSGLMSWGLTQAGMGIGRLTADGFWQTLPRIASGGEQAGDLVLFGSRYGTSGLAGHIGVVIDPAQKLMMHTYSSGSPADISRYDTWDSRNGGPLGYVEAIPANSTPSPVAADSPGVLQPA